MMTNDAVDYYMSVSMLISCSGWVFHHLIIFQVDHVSMPELCLIPKMMGRTARQNFENL